MLRFARPGAVLAALLLSTGVASAEDAPAPPGRGACRADAERLCKDLERGGGAVARCLREHENELSDACRDQLDSRGRRAGRVREACSEDADRLCPDVERGTGATLRCLREHESELSEGCKSVLPSPPAE
jgi:hypothetical protein